MKKICFLIFLLSCALVSGAQSLHLAGANGPLANNANITLWCGDSTNDFHLYVHNTAGSNINVLVKKTYFYIIFGSTNYFCWGNCQPAENMVSDISVTIPAGFTDSINFVGHYIPQGNPGTSVIRYTFFDESNLMDSVCVNVTFHGMTGLGIDEPGKLDVFSAPYPNPLKDQCNIQYSIGEGHASVPVLKLYDLQGRIVKDLLLSGQNGSCTIDARGLVAGYYFCTIEEGNKCIYSQKILVL
ncbi:MAG: T9SS type A sorting domain-containing protein [Bacteroidota bacterium]